MATTQSVNEAISTFVRDTELAHQIVHGGDSTQVQTDGGVVDSMAKTIKGMRDDFVSGVGGIFNTVVGGYAAEAKTALDQAQTASSLALNIYGSTTAVANAVAASQASANQAKDNATLTAQDRNQTGINAIDAAASATKAVTQATLATTKAQDANTSAGASSGYAAQALAIYGNTTVMQTAVAQAAAQASLAAGHAASASSVVQQDLSGVTAAALHRSPNAVTAMFVYDTSKDSDGGAWTEKCQHTSWYNEAINGKWLGAQASEAAARAVSGATTGDYFQLTTGGKFYKLNATSGITEVFRGNKRDFPRLAAIVAEAASVTIYDLTEPGRPMWMRFVASGTTSFTTSRAVLGPDSQSAVFALNGVLATGATGNSGYQGSLINFAADRVPYLTNGATGSFIGNIARRNEALGFSYTGGYGTIASTSINAVAMTVLPDAPVDPVTGLKVPTIAVATSGGVSVIKHNGTVVSQLANTVYVAFAEDTRLWAAGSDGGSFAVHLINKAFTSVEASFANIRYAVGAPYIAGNSVGRLPQLRAAAGNAVYAVDPDTYKTVNILRSNNSKKVGSSVAYICETFNTGHQPGDIRCTYLADVDVGNVSGPELVTNGTFDTSSGWTLTPGLVGGESASISGGVLVLGRDTATNSYGTSFQAITTVVGKNYQIVVSTSAGTAVAAARIGIAGMSGSSGEFSVGPASKTAGRFVAASTTTYISIYASSTGTANVDSVRVQEVVADRSYKAKGASINGTLTKSAVASAAQMVAYSGFSAANYLREPYSADLDFGTNEWSVGAWVNVPVTLPTSNFPFVDIEWFVDPNITDIANFPAEGTPTTREIDVDGNLRIVGGHNHGVRISGIPNKLYRYEVEVKVNSGTLKFQLNYSGAYANQVIDLEPGWQRLSFIASGGGYLVLAGSGGIDAVIRRLSIREVGASLIADRSHSSGPKINLGVTGTGLLTATASDGTTTRTVTTTAAYNTATWAKAEACYTTDGSLALLVNGVGVAVTRGAPLLTLNNPNAVLTIGNSYAADAPFPGSIALLKLSATVPTPEQSVWMYEQEKQMFRDGAQCCLPDSGTIVDLAYDDATDKWIAVSATNESEWSGLVRTSVTPVPAGSYTKAAAASGVQLLARSTTSPGVDITIPAYGLREELVKRAESAARLNANLATFDYVGGFTASTTTGSTSITSVAGLSYPTSTIGAKVTGAGIPTDTVITAVSGTTIYLSKAATATGTAVQISFTDFALPVGYEAKAVMSAGTLKQEGSTKDFTRLFDGFKETIRFGVAPGYTAWVQIQATRSAT